MKQHCITGAIILRTEIGRLKTTEVMTAPQNLKAKTDSLLSIKSLPGAHYRHWSLLIREQGNTRKKSNLRNSVDYIARELMLLFPSDIRDICYYRMLPERKRLTLADIRRASQTCDVAIDSAWFDFISTSPL